jgi:hypothetical protein
MYRNVISVPSNVHVYLKNLINFGLKTNFFLSSFEEKMLRETGQRVHSQHQTKTCFLFATEFFRPSVNGVATSDQIIWLIFCDTNFSLTIQALLV